MMDTIINEKKEKTLKISSLVCGILSLVLFLMPYFGLPLGILAIVFDNKSKIKSANMIGSPAGKVTGIIGIVINSILLLFLVGMMIAVFNKR